MISLFFLSIFPSTETLPSIQSMESTAAAVKFQSMESTAAAVKLVREGLSNSNMKAGVEGCLQVLPYTVGDLDFFRRLPSPNSTIKQSVQDAKEPFGNEVQVPTVIEIKHPHIPNNDTHWHLTASWIFTIIVGITSTTSASLQSVRAGISSSMNNTTSQNQQQLLDGLDFTSIALSWLSAIALILAASCKDKPQAVNT